MPRLPVAKSSNTQHIYFPSLWITIPISSFFFDGYNDHFIKNIGYGSYADNIYQFWEEKHQRP
jgi:hypothetical protein